MVLAQDVQADLLMVWGIDLSVLEQKLVVRREGEGAVVVGLIGGGGSKVVLGEESVLGGVVNL
ncbi:hypothetical protein C0993_007645, partial [Termitomyces sp. T159_Od127]